MDGVEGSACCTVVSESKKSVGFGVFADDAVNVVSPKAALISGRRMTVIPAGSEQSKDGKNNNAKSKLQHDAESILN